jgi:hypothetical protein
MGSLCRVDSQVTLNPPASELASATHAAVALGFSLGRVFVTQRGVPLLHLPLGFLFLESVNLPHLVLILPFSCFH